jgi:hypothetical protein
MTMRPINVFIHISKNIEHIADGDVINMNMSVKLITVKFKDFCFLARTAFSLRLVNERLTLNRNMMRSRLAMARRENGKNE